jgi:hypothetical protein
MWTHLVIVAKLNFAFSERAVEAHESVLVQVLRPNLPLKLSMNSLAVGVPGREKSRITPLMYVYASNFQEPNSLP